MVIASLTAATGRFSSMSEASDMACVDCPLPQGSKHPLVHPFKEIRQFG